MPVARRPLHVAWAHLDVDRGDAAVERRNVDRDPPGLFAKGREAAGRARRLLFLGRALLLRGCRGVALPLAACAAKHGEGRGRKGERVGSQSGPTVGLFLAWETLGRARSGFAALQRDAS